MTGKQIAHLIRIALGEVPIHELDICSQLGELHLDTTRDEIEAMINESELGNILTTAVIDTIMKLLQDVKSVDEAEEFTFQFDHSNDPRKGTPYVAKITGIDDENKFQREFYDLERTYGKKTVLVEGEYTAKNGDIIEQRHGGSWKNDYRYLYLIHEGKEVEIGHITDARTKSNVRKYLLGKLEATNLL